MKHIKSLAAGILALTATSAAAEDARFVSWAYAEAPGRAFIEREVAEIDTNVEMVGFPWKNMLENLVLRHRSRQPTEAAQIQERWLPTLVQIGALQDLNELIGEERLEELVEPGLLAMGEVDGKRFGVPWTAASIAMVANKKVLDAAGVTELPETMDEFYAALKAIKNSNPDAIPFGLSTSNAGLIQVESQIIFWQFGARFFEDGEVVVDSDEAREALAFIVKLVEEGLVAKGNDRFATRNLFAQELVGFYFDPPVARSFTRKLTGQGADYDKNLIVMPTPQTGNGEPPRSVVWAHLLGMMSAGSPNADAGVEVISHFALDPETQREYWEELGLFPTTKAALEEIGQDPYVADWIKLAETALFDEPAAFANSAELSQIIGEEVQAAMLGVKSSDEAISDMAARLEAAL